MQYFAECRILVIFAFSKISKDYEEDYIFIICLMSVASMAQAQKTCVIASAEDHVPIREALIHTDKNQWARTDYRGYWNMRYQFDSATVSKPGYVKATIRYKELPDTVFLLPEAKQIGEVTVWGKNQQHIDDMEGLIQEQVNSIPTSPGGIGFDAFGWMDKQGKRDRKHLEKRRESLRKWTAKTLSSLPTRRLRARTTS